MQVKFTPAYVKSLKPDGKPHWIRDAVEKKLLLFLGRKGKKTWYLDYNRSDGKRDCYKIGDVSETLPVAKAREKAREILVQVQKEGGASLKSQPQLQPQIQVTTSLNTSGLKLRELIDDYYAQWVLNSRRSGEATLAMIHNAFADFMEQPIMELTLLQVEQWRIKYRCEQKLKASSINRYTTTLKAVLNWGFKRKLIDANPLVGMETLSEDDSVPKKRYLSDDEHQRLLKALDDRETTLREERSRYNQWCIERKKDILPDLYAVPFADHLKPLVLLSLNTGIRRNALFSLIWNDVDFRNKVLTLRQGSEKTSKDGQINLNQTALDVFEQWRSQSVDVSGDALIFPSPKNGKIMGHCNSSWEALLKDANIQNFRWHDMRHDFASQLVINGVNLNTVRELMGHSDIKMTLRYAHLAPTVKQSAVETLNKNFVRDNAELKT